MTLEHQFPLSPRMEAAIAEMKELIASHYPTATFSVYEWDDPEGIFLSAVVDTDDMAEVKRLYLSRMVDLQVDEGLPLFVVPLPTRERHEAMLRKSQESAELLVP
jgi:hypothetical protein